MVIGEVMLCNQFLVAPQFCINSLDLAELGELNYLARIGSYEAAFFLSTVVDSADFLCNQQSSVTGKTGRLVPLCNQGIGTAQVCTIS